MYISKIKIKNYRLLIDAELEVDAKTTLIVGRNNTAIRLIESLNGYKKICGLNIVEKSKM